MLGTSHLISVDVTSGYYRFQDLAYGALEIKKVRLNGEVFSVFMNKGLRTTFFYIMTIKLHNH